MQEIAFEIDAQRVGRASCYLGGLTIERYTFTGATIPAGTRLAILTRAGVTIAAAEIAEENSATVDTNTQEVADLLRYQPLGACESVYIALGNADTIIALIPAVMRKNWLDDEATHPPVPANRYPTKTELEAWLARFDERAAAAETAKADAQEAAAQAAQRATDARAAKTAAESAASAAQTAQGKAEAAQAAAQAAQKGAEDAKAAAAQSATAAAQSAQEAASDVTSLLKGKVDAAEAAKAGAEAAKAAAETAKTGADAAKAAAASSATAAANSATAAAKSATDLADAVATAESLDGRILKLEKGKGVYQASDGSIQIYTPFDLCADGTLKVVKTVGKFRNILPVEVEESSDIFFAGDHNYIYFLVGTGGTFKNRLFVYDHNFNRIANYRLPILVSTYFGGCYWNDRLYLARMNYGFAFLVLDKSGTVLKSFVPEISEEGATPVEDLGLSIFFYNPKSGHMCCFSPQPNGNGRPSYLFAFDDDLNQIVEEDGTYRVRSFRLDKRFSMQAAVIHGTAYLFPIRGGDYEYEIANCPVFRVTEDDRLEIVRESIPRTDEDGNILYMTEQVTDEAGNVTEEIARDEWNRNILLPQTDDGDEIRYNVAISDKENRPLMTAGGAFRIRPIVRYSNVMQGGQYKAVTYFDGVDAYLILKDGRWIDLWRLNNPFDGTAKKLRPKNDRSSAFTKKTMRIFSCGTEWQVWGVMEINNALVYDSASTVPFSNYHSLSLSISGNVTRGADILFDLSVGTPLRAEYGGRSFNCLVHDYIPSACIFGSRPWTSTYSNIIGGGY